MGLDAMILVFWMLNFKPAFSLSSFTFIKRLFSSLLSAIRVVSSAYLRLLIFLPAIFISSYASSSPAFLMMYSACKLNKQGDNNGISLEGMMLKLKLQYFGYLMQRVDSLEKTLMLGGIGGRRRRGRPRVPHTARRGAWDPLSNSRGQRGSLPQTRRGWQPTPVFLPGESQGREA